MWLVFVYDKRRKERVCSCCQYISRVYPFHTTTVPRRQFRLLCLGKASSRSVALKWLFLVTCLTEDFNQLYWKTPNFSFTFQLPIHLLHVQPKAQESDVLCVLTWGTGHSIRNLSCNQLEDKSTALSRIEPGPQCVNHKLANALDWKPLSY